MTFNQPNTPKALLSEVHEIMRPVGDIIAYRLIKSYDSYERMTEQDFELGKRLALVALTLMIGAELCKIDNDKERAIMLNLLRITSATIITFIQDEKLLLEELA